MSPRQDDEPVLVFTLDPEGWMVCTACGEKSLHHGYDC